MAGGRRSHLARTPLLADQAAADDAVAQADTAAGGPRPVAGQTTDDISATALAVGSSSSATSSTLNPLQPSHFQQERCRSVPAGGTGLSQARPRRRRRLGDLGVTAGEHRGALDVDLVPPAARPVSHGPGGSAAVAVGLDARPRYAWRASTSSGPPTGPWPDDHVAELGDLCQRVAPDARIALKATGHAEAGQRAGEHHAGAGDTRDEGSPPSGRAAGRPGRHRSAGGLGDHVGGRRSGCAGRRRAGRRPGRQAAQHVHVRQLVEVRSSGRRRNRGGAKRRCRPRREVAAGEHDVAHRAPRASTASSQAPRAAIPTQRVSTTVSRPCRATTPSAGRRDG